MVFSSTIFIFVFLPITLAVYYLIKGNARNYWLLFVSLIFFGWAQPNYLWIIISNIFINYCGAIFLEWIEDKKIIRKISFAVIIIANIGILFYYKYFMFTLEVVNSVIGSDFTCAKIILPIGISFFTFQGISYVADVYKKDTLVQKNPFKLALYISLFPQLIAGPIVRYEDIAREIDSRNVRLDDFCYGIQRFIVGLSKKVIIANTMASMVDSVWGNRVNTSMVAWAASIAYTLQIYFDFSGYSDMAIGLGRMFGFRFNENFDLPYTSNSISEFWRRWHISLSSWFRDYVYIPLGGNRKHVYVNLAIVFLLTGIWHGASWNFILWGMWNGVFILIERFVRNHIIASRVESKGLLRIVKTVLGKSYTLLLVNLGWVLFRAPDMLSAIMYGLSMTGKFNDFQTGYTLFWYLDRWTMFAMLLGILFATSLPTKISERVAKCLNVNTKIFLSCVATLILFYLSILRIVAGTYNPFIYFQF